MESPQGPGKPKQRHWPEQKVHDFSGHSRARRESRDNPWRFCPARCRRFNLDNARGDPKEDFRLAHWLLGEIRDKWVELRHHAHRDGAESSDQVSQLFICRGEPDAGPIETGSSPSFPYLHDLADDSGRPTFRE